MQKGDSPRPDVPPSSGSLTPSLRHSSFTDMCEDYQEEEWTVVGGQRKGKLHGSLKTKARLTTSVNISANPPGWGDAAVDVKIPESSIQQAAVKSCKSPVTAAVVRGPSVPGPSFGSENNESVERVYSGRKARTLTQAEAAIGRAKHLRVLVEACRCELFSWPQDLKCILYIPSNECFWR